MARKMFDADHEWIVRIHTEFHRFAQARRHAVSGTRSIEVPTPQMLADLLEVAFWASLRTDEGRPTRVRISAVQTGALDRVLAFKDPVPYTEEEVAKLA